MTKTNTMLESSSINLAVALDDTAQSTKDAQTSLELVSNTSMDYAVSQERLTKSLNRENTVSKKNADLNAEYQDSLQKRILLEEQISKQSPIIRYSEPAANDPEHSDSPRSDGENKAIQTIDDYLKEQLGTSKEFKDAYIKDANKSREQRAKFVRKISDSVNIIGKMKSSDSAAGRLAGAAMSKGVSAVSEAMDNLLGQIPGYTEAKELSKFVVKTVSDVNESKRSKKLDRDSSNEYDRRVREETSKFERKKESDGRPLPSPVPNPDEKRENKEESDDRKGNQTERKEKKEERKESEKRYHGISGLLDSIKDALRFSAIINMISTMARIGGGLTSMFSGITKVLTSGFSKLATPLAILVKHLTGQDIDLDFDKKKKGDAGRSTTVPDPDKKKQSPSSDVDLNKPSPKPSSDTTQNPNPSTENKPKPDTKKPSLDVNTKGSKFDKVPSGIGGMIAKGAKSLFKWIPYVGAAMTTFDVANMAAQSGMLGKDAQKYFGYNEDGTEMEVAGPVYVKTNDFRPAPFSYGNQAEEISTVLSAKEKEEKRKEQELIVRAHQANANHNNTVVNTASHTTVLPGGFGYVGDNYNQPVRYGEQPTR